MTFAARLGDIAGLAMALQYLSWLKFLLGDIATAGRPAGRHQQAIHFSTRALMVGRESLAPAGG